MDGHAVAATILADTAERAAAFERRTGRKPCLATVLVGDDPASHTYVRMKVNRCRSTGLDSRRYDLPAETTTEEAVALVRELSGVGLWVRSADQTPEETVAAILRDRAAARLR